MDSKRQLLSILLDDDRIGIFRLNEDWQLTELDDLSDLEKLEVQLTESKSSLCEVVDYCIEGGSLTLKDSHLRSLIFAAIFRADEVYSLNVTTKLEDEVQSLIIQICQERGKPSTQIPLVVALSPGDGQNQLFYVWTLSIMHEQAGDGRMSEKGNAAIVVQGWAFSGKDQRTRNPKSLSLMR